MTDDNQAVIAMSQDEFCEWAEQRYGVSYDQICLLDMLRSLDAEIAEQPKGTISLPDELRDVLLARKAIRPDPIPARSEPFTNRMSEWEARGSRNGE